MDAECAKKTGNRGMKISAFSLQETKVESVIYKTEWILIMSKKKICDLVTEFVMWMEMERPESLSGTREQISMDFAISAGPDSWREWRRGWFSNLVWNWLHRSGELSLSLALSLWYPPSLLPALATHSGKLEGSGGDWEATNIAS